MTEVKLERDPFTGEAMYRLTAVRQDASDRDAGEMRAAAESGKPEAMCRYAETLYDHGDPESIRWFRRAAESGDGYSCWCLASCLLFGDGTDRDPGEAVTWLLKAAGSYYIPVFYDLGVCARIGLGTPTDGEAAVRWFKKAAERGNTDALYEIGRTYEHGMGVGRSYWEASIWYSLAAQKGHVLAQHALGVFYEEGRVERSYRKAVKWYTLAAESGHVPSQTRLAHLYLQGLGVARSAERAVALLTNAAMNGDSGAKDALMSLKSDSKVGAEHAGEAGEANASE